MDIDPDPVLAATKEWLEKTVIGLNLCPFAKAVHAAGQIRWKVSAATSPDQLVAELAEELIGLHEADPAKVDTTMLMVPRMFEDFLDFNDFLDTADDLLGKLGLVGHVQVASFHPRYRFEGTADDDPTNRTNRSPVPTLHLLREISVSRAVEGYPDAEGIPERNMETMRRLGREGRLPP